MTSPSDTHGPYRSSAEEFIREHGEGRDAYWHKFTREARSNIDPALFEHSEKRSRGEEPPPDSFTWPRSETELEHDFRVITRKIQEKKGGDAIFSTIDYGKAYSGRYVQDLEESPLYENLGPKGEAKTEGGWILGQGPRIGTFAIEPSHHRAREVDLEVTDINNKQSEDEDVFRQPVELAELWGTRNPKSWPGSAKRWTEGQKRQLIIVIVEREIDDWDAIANNIELSKTECQERYRELADLPLYNPKQGRWTAKEDTDLLRFRDEYESRDWIRTSSHLERTVESCQQRYQQLTEDPQMAPRQPARMLEHVLAQRLTMTEQSEAHTLTESDGGCDWQTQKRRRDLQDEFDNGTRPTKTPRKCSPISSTRTEGSKSISRISEQTSLCTGSHPVPTEKQGRSRTRAQERQKTPANRYMWLKNPRRRRVPPKDRTEIPQICGHKRQRDNGDEDANPRPSKRLILSGSFIDSSTKAQSPFFNRQNDERNQQKHSKRRQRMRLLGPKRQDSVAAQRESANRSIETNGLRPQGQSKREVSQNRRVVTKQPLRRSKRIAKAQKSSKSKAGNEAPQGDSSRGRLRRSSRIAKRSKKS